MTIINVALLVFDQALDSTCQLLFLTLPHTELFGDNFPFPRSFQPVAFSWSPTAVQSPITVRSLNVRTIPLELFRLYLSDILRLLNAGVDRSKTSILG
jgi:hypothetical protein